jgi:predicted HicB family RNase H-like nuclease
MPNLFETHPLANRAKRFGKSFYRQMIGTVTMTAISLRLPESLHRIARELAEEEGVSMNQLITLALAEKSRR